EDVPVRIVGRLVLDRMVDNFFAETEQVAFCTQNIVPGIDFTNDPLLQGRNFSYLDTQTKRLGGPNFTHIPINAPKCPFHHFQQDGHMAMHNPVGRANYEPNGWAQGGPRADPEKGHRSYPEQVDGEKRKVRGELFADHYSQARQFYISQTGIEQDHIASAIVFELSKVETPAIRERLVAHLPNIDKDLAAKVADGLGLKSVPKAHTPARTPVEGLKPSDSLSILKNGPDSFAGRKMGLLLTDGIDDDLLDGVMNAIKDAGGIFEVVAPKIGGIVTAGGKEVPAQQKIDGGPSVLYDAVVILASEDGAKALKGMHAAKTFAADAFAHGKFIGVGGAGAAFLKSSGIDSPDDGVIALNKKGDAKSFVSACAKVRFWDRLS
ncbi:MAG: catalase, partial [Rhodobacterales bacterium]